MADIELVIKIPEGEYGTIKQFEKLGKYSDKNDAGQRALSRIANGIPHHLRIVKIEAEDMESQDPVDCANADHDADGCLGYSTDRGGYSYCQTCEECPKASINNYDKEQEPYDNILTLTQRVVTQVTEDMDNFIFTTIKSWCEEKEQRKISKRDLEQALTQYFRKELCDDVISRDAVLNAISDFVALEKYIDKHNHITFEPLEQMINSLPPVQPKRQKERWIVHRNYYECPVCGSRNMFTMNFCSDCGADMREEQTE